jgi:hypothetical protein
MPNQKVEKDTAAQPQNVGGRETQGESDAHDFCRLASTFIAQGSVHAADKIRIAYSAGTGSLLFLLAHKRGFLKAEELTLRLSG